MRLIPRKESPRHAAPLLSRRTAHDATMSVDAPRHAALVADRFRAANHGLDANGTWCGTKLSQACPYHDDGQRFACHLPQAHAAQAALNQTLYRKCLNVPDVDACAALANRTIIFVGDSMSESVARTFRCHLCTEERRLRGGCPPPEMPWASSIGLGFAPDDSNTRGVHPELFRCQRFDGCGTVCTLHAGVRSHGAPNSSRALQLLLRSDAVPSTPSANGSTILVFNEGLWWTSDQQQQHVAQCSSCRTARVWEVAPLSAPCPPSPVAPRLPFCIHIVTPLSTGRGPRLGGDASAAQPP